MGHELMNIAHVRLASLHPSQLDMGLEILNHDCLPFSHAFVFFSISGHICTFISRFAQ